jgi:hypothetical protein
MRVRAFASTLQWWSGQAKLCLWNLQIFLAWSNVIKVSKCKSIVVEMKIRSGIVVRRYTERNGTIHSENNNFLRGTIQLISWLRLDQALNGINLLNPTKIYGVPVICEERGSSGHPRSQQAHTRVIRGLHSPQNKTPPPISYVWICWQRLYICPPPLMHTSVQASKWEIEMSEFWNEF